MSIQKSEAVDAYIAQFPKNTQDILQKIRRIVHKIVPEVAESIAYGMPAFKINKKPVVYVAGWEHHIGFYATPAGNLAFQKELAQYQGAKGSVKFPLDQAMPYGLIEKIVKYRREELEGK